jgi:hypothetical protein
MLSSRQSLLTLKRTVELNMNRIVMPNSLLALIFLALIGSGCSISYSFEKSSDSIAASSDSLFSSSTSSGGSEKEVQAAMQRYSDDVKGLTASYSRENGDAYTFERQLGSLARSYGLTDWQGEASTYQAIGVGLRQAGVKRDALRGTPFLQSSAIKENFGWIVEGYLGA